MISNKQKLELTWIGKNNPEYDIANIEPRILEERTDLSYGDKNTENMIIHGDNLLALKALLPEFEGKVKCICIDPPYNTGSAFEHYDDSAEHSTWLSLMKPRLELLKMLLHPDQGSIWIAIDDNESHYLKVLCDEVFGRGNFVANIVWQKRTSPDNRLRLGDAHDNILVYKKKIFFSKEVFNQLPVSDSRTKDFKNPDNDPRGEWASTDFTGQTGHATPSQFYTIYSPSGVAHPPPDGRCWALAEETFKKLLADNRVWFGKDGKARPRLKRFLREMAGQNSWSWWTNSEVGHNQEAKKEIVTLFGANNAFDTPKPERLLKRILEIATNSNDLILDSFLGSGTTAAVAHKMGRKYIGIEMGNHAYTHCKVRLDKVIDNTDQGGISQAVDWKGGGGFKFYELAPSFVIIDEFGNPVIDSYYNDTKLIRAMCKLTNYVFAPNPSDYWKQGKGQGSNSIYVTTQMLSVAMVQQIVNHLDPNETLLICPKKYEPGCEKVDSRITIKKIPQSVLKSCQFGKKEYLLPAKELTLEEIEEEDLIDDQE